jgi:signal transduction histidine kinase
MFCTDIPAPYLFIFSNSVPKLFYYSHVPVLIATLLLGMYVFYKDKSLASRFYFIITILFSVWNIFSMLTWTNVDTTLITFVWGCFGLLIALLFFSFLYFSYAYIYNKLPGIIFNTINLLLLLPVVLFASHSVSDFNLDYCEVMENSYYGNYTYVLGYLVAIMLVVISFRALIKDNFMTRKRQIILLLLGSVSFILIFTTLGMFSFALDNFEIENYSLFGMLFFLSTLTYLIVHFKAFDIKLIGAQALVWALIILIGSQFFFIQNNVNRVLTAITLVISAIVGLMIIRSVKKEVAQREELAVANENQQLLIRFITHQVKGFFTKSKMVFASLLEGDFGQIPEAVTPVLKEGLESDNKAVEMVQEVLKASSLRSGTMTYNFEETDLKEFVAGIAETLKETAVGKGLAYEVNLPAEKALSKIDRLQMTQVIKNLIDNSVKYTLTGFVHVNLKVKNVSEGRRAIKTALFSVEDSGVGLSDGDKAKLFKEGGRGEESLKVNVNSTGYGLFIVKKIVEGHGGKIWAESRGRGHGTKFFVEIPLADSSLK